LGNKNRASTVINSDIQNLLMTTNHGEVKPNANDLDSSVDVTIDPANENCGHELNAEGMLPTGDIPDTFAAAGGSDHNCSGSKGTPSKL
jgi:hypothetical protein